MIENNNALSYCDICKDNKLHVKTIKTKHEEHLKICLSCRKKYNAETEDDIIVQIKEKIRTPKEIVEYLDSFIVGQDLAKKTIAVEVFNHFLRVTNPEGLDGKKLKKNNIMLTGPSGTGKTLLAETLANILGVPFTIANATSLTESGYVGSDVESILSSLLIKADGNPEKAKYGIVYIDEIDKIAKKGENLSTTRDVSGEGVQQALLKLVEGSIVGVPENGGRIHPQQKLINIDTTNILFICGGAFVGIEDIVKKRVKAKNKSTSNAIGFGAKLNSPKDALEDAKNSRRLIEIDDLKSFGMIPEFLGRFPSICNLEPLDKEHLIEILRLDSGILEEYKTIFKLQGKELLFTEDCLDVIAEHALNKKVGARGLRGILSSLMRDLMFNAPSEDNDYYVIDSEYILNFFNETNA